MNVSVAFLCVVLVWSTTPLAIVWSNGLGDPLLAIFLRMLIATIIASIVLITSRITLPLHKQAIKLYFYSSLGVFFAMTLSYLSARYISSGMISLMFGLSPIVSGLLAQKILKEDPFSRSKIFALSLAIIGLCIVFYNNINASLNQSNVDISNYLIGLTCISLAVFSFCLSAVLVKTVEIQIHALSTTIGTLYVSTLLLLMTWYCFGEELENITWSILALSAISYLGVFGSLVGFVAYYYILQHLTASTVSLTTLITPTFAISLGVIFNDESISFYLLIGSGLILFALSLYHWGDKWNNRRAKR